MTIQTALANLQQDITNARTAITNKGGTVTTGGDSSHLATDIATIPTASTIPATITRDVDANGVIIFSSSYSSSPATDVGDYGLASKFAMAGGSLTIVDLSSLTSISGISACGGMCWNCTNLTSVNFNSLTSISGLIACRAMFQQSGITTVNLPSLETLSGQRCCQEMYKNCYSLTSVDLSSLKKITGDMAMYDMFRGCTSLTSVTIGGTEAIDFGSYTNQFATMFGGCTQNITVTAPNASKSIIEALNGYPKFGASSSATVTWNWR